MTLVKKLMILKFKVDDTVRISKYESIFAKACVANCSEEVLIMTNVENTVLWTYLNIDLKGVIKRKKS